jgi:hypothetical protein
MDLFDLFTTSPSEVKPESKPCKLILPLKPDIAAEIIKIAKTHGCDIPWQLADDLADIICDRPPWSPWADI